MNLGIGGIVSVGGGAGGGGTSGIQTINPGGNTGPIIEFQGVNGVDITSPGANVILIDGLGASGVGGGGIQSGVIGINGIDVEQVAGDFVVNGAALSGLIVPSGGIGAINGQIGPVIEIVGVNGITVTVPSENEILINGAASSGTICFSEAFTNITSTTLTHNLGSTNVIVDVFDESNNKLLADRVGIVDLNSVTLEFNRPQTGKAVIVACVSDVSATELLCEAKRYSLLVS